jgi:hypothetical protein
MRAIIFAVIGLLSVASSARAADSMRIEVAGGYVFLRDVTGNESFNGWLGSVGASLGQSFDLIGEIGGSYDTIDLGIATARVSEASFLGGAKFASHRELPLTPFFEVLIGGVRVNASAFQVSNAQTYFAAQPGGGVDASLTRNLGARFEADYRVVQINGLADKHFRFVAGFVFHN